MDRSTDSAAAVLAPQSSESRLVDLVRLQQADGARVADLLRHA